MLHATVVAKNVQPWLPTTVSYANSGGHRGPSQNAMRSWCCVRSAFTFAS